MLLIMAFGAMGALARFGINQLALRVFGPHFPYGTLIANIAGCLLFGYLVQALAVDTFYRSSSGRGGSVAMASSNVGTGRKFG